MIESFSQVWVVSSEFRDNYADTSGGAIASSSYLDITSTNFTANSAGINGNDIFFKCTDDLYLDKVTVLASLGRSIFVWGRKFEAYGLTIKGDINLSTNDLDESKGI